MQLCGCISWRRNQMFIEIYVDGELVYEDDFDIEDEGVEYDEDGVAWYFDEEDEIWYFYDEIEEDWYEWDEDFDDYYDFDENEV
jgi:hypothetical protein